MPVSREGHTYNRYLFKPLPDTVTGGCHADVFLPTLEKGEKAPIAITYHGGGFVICDSQHILTRHVGYLLSKGFAVVGLEYRMAPHVRFPEIREDIVDGYKWVLDVLPTLAPLDPSRVCVMGASAGGYATLSLSIDAHRLGLPLPKANYAVYPLADLTSTLKRPSERVTHAQALALLSDEDRVKVDALFAEPITTRHDRMKEDPADLSGRMVWGHMAMLSGTLLECLTSSQWPYPTEHSPMQHLHDKFPPTVLVLAEADTLLDPVTTSVLHDRLEELGVESLLLVGKDMPHGAMEPEMGAPEQGKEWWDDVAVPALEFCVRHCQ
ncbi:hypothetical protein CspHIS471_0604680 [Cutaneotrichosporon sp. HIS471]|nr:hypothetical protein CspHIS471_0604680 [Cutaneotrichosporon sp. HIS471]